MARTPKAKQEVVRTTSGVVLPKGGIQRINIGQSFAEYDPALEDLSTYVHTPAYKAAEEFSNGRLFFVGRRGTGKTALRRYCETTHEHTSILVPEIFSPSSTLIELDLLRNSSKRPFRSLVSAFRRALQDELLWAWRRNHPEHANFPVELDRELTEFGQLDFDTRALQFIARISRPLNHNDEISWLAENKIAKQQAELIKRLQSGSTKGYTLCIDSIDDFWEGNDESLVYLTAFMHACLELSTQIPWMRTLLFLRENIFERVRAYDSESSRLETAVVGMEWTSEQLIELVERRLNRPFNTKFGLGGATWNAWFEVPDQARGEVLSYCQRRPRDVLIYISNAIEAAQGHQHSTVMLSDLGEARRRFSDNRMKDLGDEYAENFPQIALVLSRFYGLGRRFTLSGIESMIAKLQMDSEITKHCSTWIWEKTASPEVFVRLLYDVGFVGVERAGAALFRGLGPNDTSAPAIGRAADIVIHQCYWDALDLQNVLVRELPEGVEFGRVGRLVDLPDGMNFDEYNEHLDELLARLQTLPTGSGHATEFEDLVGEVIRLCFFRALGNVESKSRDYEGRTIRDWVASNRAQSGFWAAVSQRYQAHQVTWECKNYEDIGAEDFQQVSYYVSDASGRLVVIAFRGREVSQSMISHIKRIHVDKGALVLPLGQRDLMTFIRQARKGKVKEDHIQDRYDHILRRIS